MSAPLASVLRRGLALRLYDAAASRAALHGSSLRGGPGGVASGFTAESPLTVAVVGSGPAGCYTVDRLLHRYGARCRVTLLERLPAPFGLVRYGVAPDHGATSAPVAERFGRLLAHPQVRVLLGAPVGEHSAWSLSVQELRRRHHAVVLATGAPEHAPLPLPAHAPLANVLSARHFVAWYCGHPEHAQAPADLTEGAHAVLVGLGNVAVDCARLLLRAPGDLRATDMPHPVQAAFALSRVRHVTVLVRRSAAHVAATPKELKELLSLPGVRVRLVDAHLSAQEAQELSAAPRPRRRALEELQKAATRDAAAWDTPDGQGAHKSLTVRFLASPVALTPSSEAGRGECVGGVTVRSNAQPDAALLHLPASLVIASVGSRGAPLATLPFDHATGTFPHDAGCVDNSPGLYAVGWCKRGATGIIGINLTCAEETVATLAMHADQGLLPAPAQPDDADALMQMVAARGGRVLNAQQWARVDAVERSRGAALGKVREKVTTSMEMVELGTNGGEAV